jgi:hypothetical protein
MAKYIGQKSRLVIFLVKLLILFGMNYWAFSTLLPPIGGKGLWFYSALISALLANHLVTPYFTKPVDAISYSVISGIALYVVIDLESWTSFDQIVFAIALAYFTTITIAGFIQIYTKDSPRDRIQKLSNTFRIITENLGSPNAVFSGLLVAAILLFHRNNASELIPITIAWVLVVLSNPLETLFNIFRRVKSIWIQSFSKGAVGEIIAYQSPKIVLVRQFDSQRLNFGEVILLKDPYAPIKLGIAIDYIGRDESILLRILEINIPSKIEDKIFNSLKSMSNNTAAALKGVEAIKQLTQESYLLNNKEEFVGLVSVNTSVEKLYLEVIEERDIAEGRLVEVNLRNQKVLYQVIDGLTKEEIIKKKNKYGYARAEARKVGIWNGNESKFQKAEWLPKLNAPVYLKSASDYKPTIQTVGRFPNTNYVTEIESIDDLVTHNTAILGILGIGKSMLSIELVERMMAENIKVICLDLTNQYKKELYEFYREDIENEKLKVIQEAGQKDKKEWADNHELGGSLPNLSEAIHNDLNNFIHEEDSSLKIYNPSEFLATKQTYDPKSYTVDGEWKRGAALYTVTPVEITRIISETALDLVKDKMRDKAKVCLVYEEAHSLIPEWNSVTQEGDKEATNGTARAILQGRKYGLGCLLVTQRTANVTKTILNQCNTIFAMRTFDQTGKKFLANYLGEDYANILQNLKERQAVFYGKASSCENPVQLRLNDQDDFRGVFREEFPPPTIYDMDEENNNENGKSIKNEIDDDLPF